MDASVVSKPTGSPNTTPIAKGETKRGANGIRSSR